MADEYDIEAGGNRGSLLTVILANILWTVDFEAAGTSEAASTLECCRQRILLTVTHCQ